LRWKDWHLVAGIRPRIGQPEHDRSESSPDSITGIQNEVDPTEDSGNAIKQAFSAYDENENTLLRKFKFCPFCGTHLSSIRKGGQQRPACPKCGFVQFRNPIPGVVVLVERDGQVLLGKRAGGFGQGRWGLPQGYTEFDEDFLTAAIREVKEETGLDVEIRSIINVVSNLLSPGLHTLAIVLLAGVVAGELCACDDLETLEWVPLAGPLPQMAFEADEHIIERYRQTELDWGLPVDPDFACLGVSSVGG
jgi:8-oxo-dGTP diphosphatase